MRIIFNYSEALLDVPQRRHRAHVQPGGRAAARALLPPDVRTERTPRGDGAARRSAVLAFSAASAPQIVAGGSLAGGEGRRGGDGSRGGRRRLRILLWHGYLLGGTGSNVYTRALAREWSRAGHDVVVVCQERHPERFDLGGAGSSGRSSRGLLPVFVLDRYEGLEAKLLQDFTRGRARRASSRRTRRRCASCCPADLVFANHVLLGGAGRRGQRRAVRVKAHGSELEYSMRGNPELAAWGREALAGADARLRRLRAHPRGARGGRRPRRPRARGAARRRRRRVRPAPRDEALAALLAEARADPPNPGNADERLPDEGNAERLAAFFAGDGPVVYFGKLIENKGVHVLLEAMRGHRRAGARRRLRRLPRASSSAGAADDALHRAARAPPPRAPAPALRRLRRAVDLPGGVRHGRRRGRRRGLPAARCAPLGPGGGRGGARGGVPAGAAATSRASRRGDAAELARSCATLLALAGAERDTLGAAARARRRRALELGEDQRTSCCACRCRDLVFSRAQGIDGRGVPLQTRIT